MNAKRLIFAALSLSFVLSTFAVATTTASSARHFTPQSSQITKYSVDANRLAEGPIPVPLCEPKVEVCPSLPPDMVVSLQHKLTVAEGPIPVPLCEPNVEVCPSLPPDMVVSPQHKFTIAEGPIPVPLCEPKVEVCPSLPPDMVVSSPARCV